MKEPSKAQKAAIKTYEMYYNVEIHAYTSQEAWRVINEFVNNGRDLQFVDGVILNTGVVYSGEVNVDDKFRTDVETSPTSFLHSLSKSMSSDDRHNDYDMLPDSFDFPTNNPHTIVE